MLKNCFSSCIHNMKSRVMCFSTQNKLLKMETIEWKDTVKFIPNVSTGKVIKVYDGDTITIATTMYNIKNTVYRFSVRLNGLDCPEMKTKDKNEKKIAVKAQKRVSDLILQKNVRLENVQLEKYGRLLADIYYNNIHINKVLIDERLAIPYDGGTKNIPKNWVQYHMTDLSLKEIKLKANVVANH